MFLSREGLMRFNINSPAKVRDLVEQAFRMDSVSDPILIAVSMDEKNRPEKVIELGRGDDFNSKENFNRVFALNEESGKKVIIARTQADKGIIPSKKEVSFLRDFRKYGMRKKMEIIDYLIIGESNYYSFHEEGYLM